MKKLFLISVILIGFTMCDNPAGKSSGTGKTIVSIFYFHGTNRCGNCMAIEENTQKALDTFFPVEVKDGLVKFISVNIDSAANKSLVEKCEASAMTLFVIKTDSDGKETKSDHTEFALNTARSKPDAYMQGIRDRIVELMKN